jgi:hypothetical protein
VTVGVSCSIVKGRTVKCVVREPGATKKSSKLKASLRFANGKKRVTRSGRGRVTLTLKSAKRVKRAQKVVVTVTKDRKTVKTTLAASGKRTLSITYR